jgi:DNA-binding CsgD family transcriptional regulator
MPRCINRGVAPAQPRASVPAGSEIDLALAEVMDEFRSSVATSLVGLAQHAAKLGAAAEAANLLADARVLFGRRRDNYGATVFLNRLDSAADSERDTTDVVVRQQAPMESHLLTPRERQVARLIARGLTNPQIATALVIAPGTVTVHIKHILAKLGMSSRAQVAFWVAQQELLADNANLGTAQGRDSRASTVATVQTNVDRPEHFVTWNASDAAGTAACGSGISQSDSGADGNSGRRRHATGPLTQPANRRLGGSNSATTAAHPG